MEEVGLSVQSYPLPSEFSHWLTLSANNSWGRADARAEQRGKARLGSRQSVRSSLSPMRNGSLSPCSGQGSFSVQSLSPAWLPQWFQMQPSSYTIFILLNILMCVCVCVWDYNIMTSYCPTLPFLQPFPCIAPCSLSICRYICVCIYIMYVYACTHTYP